MSFAWITNFVQFWNLNIFLIFPSAINFAYCKCSFCDCCRCINRDVYFTMNINISIKVCLHAPTHLKSLSLLENGAWSLNFFSISTNKWGLFENWKFQLACASLSPQVQPFLSWSLAQESLFGVVINFVLLLSSRETTVAQKRQ